MRRGDDRGRDRRAGRDRRGGGVRHRRPRRVHREARESWDVSADLAALARTPVLTVCSGVKSILDVAATLELLETSSVPVLGYRTDAFPGFYRRDSGFPVPWRVDDPAQVAAVWRAHRELGGGAGLVLAQPVPPADELDADLHDRLLTEGLELVAARGIVGKDVTPALLEHFRGQRRGEPDGQRRPGAGERGAGRAGRRGAGAVTRVVVVGDLAVDVLVAPTTAPVPTRTSRPGSPRPRVGRERTPRRGWRPRASTSAGRPGRRRRRGPRGRRRPGGGRGGNRGGGRSGRTDRHRGRPGRAGRGARAVRPRGRGPSRGRRPAPARRRRLPAPVGLRAGRRVVRRGLRRWRRRGRPARAAGPATTGAFQPTSARPRRPAAAQHRRAGGAHPGAGRARPRRCWTSQAPWS